MEEKTTKTQEHRQLRRQKNEQRKAWKNGKAEEEEEQEGVRYWCLLASLQLSWRRERGREEAAGKLMRVMEKENE